MKIKFSPKEFMRNRRPEKFSDTTRSQRSILDRSKLEYHLETLTSRNQENDFERFALALAKRTICPNLRPITGPTGGGDSKVDSETFPVHEQLSIGWHESFDLDAAHERWAFAFSAKKQWRPKVQSDIEKIVQTKRSYKKAFFISNQFVRDKARGEVEDALQKKHSIDVRILDRSWLLDQVFSGRHEELAISELKIETESSEDRLVGPRDLDRERRLTQLEAGIQHALANQLFGLNLVSDCIHAAELARTLERPRVEVDGMFERAERLAQRYGTDHQKLASRYSRAWTAYWWHEDYQLFNELYSPIEALAKDSRNAYDLELLNNLWMILFSLEKLGVLTRQELQLDTRTITLAEALQRMSHQETFPTAALQAKTHLLLQSLFYAPPEARDGIFADLELVLAECDGMIGYPVESVLALIIELGNFIEDSSAYEHLAEAATKLAGSRKGDVEAAGLLLERGAQKLAANRCYDAINLIGRALGLLSKHESQDELITALNFLGHAYEEIGLFWAARGSLLLAASLIVNRFHTYSEVSRLHSFCFRRFRWIELQLGRIPHLMAAHELGLMVRQVSKMKNVDPTEWEDEDFAFDAILGILLLRSDYSQLGEVTRLPYLLDSIGLIRAETALLYSLGHKDRIIEDFGFNPEDDIDAFFLKWSEQPAASQVPLRPLLLEGTEVIFTSRLLATTFTVTAENRSPCVELAESLLAALEAMLATAFRESVIASQPTVAISITSGSSTVRPFHYDIQEKHGEFTFTVECSLFDPNALSREDSMQIREKLWHLVIDIFARVFIMSDFEKTSQSLFVDHLVAERALSYTTSIGTFGNVFGHQPKTKVSDWVADDSPSYPVLRKQVWCSISKSNTAGGHSNRDDAEPVPPLSDDPKHNEITNASLIRLPLWDAAGWNGAYYAIDLSRSAPGALALIFKKKEAAEEIFRQWESDLGRQDPADKLRVTIIRGIRREEPLAYRLMIGTNLDSLPKSGARYFSTANRSLTMNPTNGANLSRFLESYRHFGRYFFTYANLEGNPLTPNISREIYIVKQSLHVRDAWEIGVNDIDSMGIAEDDDPLIPPGVTDVPVLELIKKAKLRRTE